MDYKFRTTPFEHQRKAFDLSRDEQVFALLMEQGTGKTKVAIDTTAYSWGRGRVDALLVIAPNGVHRNWIQNELPVHMPEYVSYIAAWYTSNMTKREHERIESLFSRFDGLRVLTINVEAFVSEKARTLVMRFLNTFNCIMIVDESSRIKTHNANRTKIITDLGKKAPIRRIMTGTPVTQSPLDIFSQFRFLDPFILRTQSYYAFKARYAELVDPNSHMIRTIMRQTGAKMAPQIVARNSDGMPIYKNLEELKALIEPHSFRVLKADCLDLPAKLYQKAYYEMPSTQRRAYDVLKREAKIEWMGASNKIQKLTLLMRLQQMAHGYIPDPEGGVLQRVFPDPEDNPRIKTLLSVLEEIQTPVIIWAKFQAELDDIVCALQSSYGKEAVVQYHGRVSRDDRDDALVAFQGRTSRFFVGQPKSGGIGLTLTAASHVIYYSNDFSLEERLQSEDRAHRIGQVNNVTYIDIEAVDSVDQKIIDALRGKKNIADQITGDPSSWL